MSASSVSPGKPICGSDVSLSEYVSTIIFHPSKPIIASNVGSGKPVSDSSVCSSKPIFGSSVRASKPIRSINVRASKPVSEHVKVSDVRPSEPISSSHTCSSNIRPSKTVSASNVCLGNPVFTNYVRPNRAICGSKVCQRKPTSDSWLFVIQTLLIQLMSFQVNLFVQTILVSLIHHYQLNRYHIYFYFPF